MKNLPIGVQTFSDFTEGNYLYVDKTKMIYKLFADGGKYFFLSRPRRFGKSLLISVLEEIFSGNRELFKGLWIYDKIEWKTYPLIHMDFSKLSYKSPEKLEKSLEKIVRKIGREYNIELDKDGDYKDAFGELIEELSKNNKVVILIDEYDKPIIDKIEKKEVAVENRDILREFFEVIKASDEFNQFVFITGVSKFSRVSVFSGLNNLRDITLSDQFSTLLGYTEEELLYYFRERISNLGNSFTKNRVLNDIRNWYNGYSWDGTNFVYNPHSILMFFQEKRFDNYWFTSGTPSLLVKLLKERQEDIRDYEKIPVGSYVFESYDIDNLETTSLLFQTGYLTVKERKRIKETEIEYILSYPNKEVRQYFVRHLFRAYTGKAFVEGAKIIRQLTQALNDRDDFRFFEIIKSLFSSISYNIFINKEAYYHSIIYMILKLMDAPVHTEVQTSTGRMDTVIDADEQIYIMELKMGSAEEALKQIKEKKYYEKYLTSDKPIKLIGVGIDEAKRNIRDFKIELLSK